ncbi:hypothetical protein Tco_0948088 [Tanacetum coccineum]
MDLPKCISSRHHHLVLYQCILRNVIAIKDIFPLQALVDDPRDPAAIGVSYFYLGRPLKDLLGHRFCPLGQARDYFGLRPDTLVNVAKQNSPRAATSISIARPVNTATPKSKVIDALPKTYSYFKAYSSARRAFNQKTAAKTNNLNEKVKTARVNNVTIAWPKQVVSAAVGNVENAIKSSAC